MDFSEWEPVVDFSEQTPEEGGILDAEKLMKLAEMQDPSPSEDDELKQALLEQHHADHFEAPDPSDGLTDDELWERMPESIRKSGA
jgi:hypothetical protein